MAPPTVSVCVQRGTPLFARNRTRSGVPKSSMCPNSLNQRALIDLQAVAPSRRSELTAQAAASVGCVVGGLRVQLPSDEKKRWQPRGVRFAGISLAAGSSF